MSNGERRPLLYQRQSRLSKQPSPERISGARKQCFGNSSQAQTVINSINVLVGIGLLSLPLGMRYAGWLPGACLLTFSALITGYTGIVLARCLESNRALQTYVDIAGASFGIEGQVITTLLFSLNMVTACVAFVILFGDTMALLMPSLSIIQWKIICGVIVLPMQFVSFRVLAPVSVVGVLSCIGVIFIVITAGLVKKTSPGSLFQPVETSLMPESWSSLCASIGLFMAPWGANASFPTFYRDMKRPQTYVRCLSEAFTVAFVIDIVMAASGYLMFGNEADREITYNILRLSTDGYPHALLVWLVGLTAIMPITKITLSSRPLVIMVENIIFGVDDEEKEEEGNSDNGDAYNVLAAHSVQPKMSLTEHLQRVLIRIITIALIVGISVVVPDFDKVVSLMGSALCYAISVVLPLLFHLKMLGKELSQTQRVFEYTLIIIGCGLAMLGTATALMR